MTVESAPANPVIWDIHETHPDLVEPLRAKLAEVVDPEITLNVIQLGLVRKVSVENGEAKMYVLLTTPFCPYGPAKRHPRGWQCPALWNLATNPGTSP